MRTLVVALLVASAISLSPAVVSAQAPQPAEAPTETLAPDVVDETAVEDDGDGRPWWRLAIFVPLSALLGAGVVLGRRAARERGWTRS